MDSHREPAGKEQGPSEAALSQSVSCTELYEQMGNPTSLLLFSVTVSLATGISLLKMG